jgi:hypothetical protein
MISSCVLDEPEVARLADMGESFAAYEKCFHHAKADGLLVAPPRHRIHFGTGALVFPISGLAGCDGSLARQASDYVKSSPQQARPPAKSPHSVSAYPASRRLDSG